MAQKSKLERRVERLEERADDCGYFILVLLVFVALDTLSVLLIWSEGAGSRVDYLGASLAIFQTMFAVAAIYGFWALRGVTKERSEEVATEIANQVATDEARSIARQEALAFLTKILDGNSNLDPDTVHAIMDALGKEDNHG